VIRTLFAIGPLLFGLAFIAPLIAQALQRSGLDPVVINHAGLSLSMPIPTLVIGLAVGGALGLVATVAGRWL
jgi:hypothetical protein